MLHIKIKKDVQKLRIQNVFKCRIIRGVPLSFMKPIKNTLDTILSYKKAKG